MKLIHGNGNKVYIFCRNLSIFMKNYTYNLRDRNYILDINTSATV